MCAEALEAGMCNVQLLAVHSAAQHSTAQRAQRAPTAHQPVVVVADQVHALLVVCSAKWGSRHAIVKVHAVCEVDAAVGAAGAAAGRGRRSPPGQGSCQVLAEHQQPANHAHAAGAPRRPMKPIRGMSALTGRPSSCGRGAVGSSAGPCMAWCIRGVEWPQAAGQLWRTWHLARSTVARAAAGPGAAHQILTSNQRNPGAHLLQRHLALPLLVQAVDIIVAVAVCMIAREEGQARARVVGSGP